MRSQQRYCMEQCGISGGIKHGAAQHAADEKPSWVSLEKGHGWP
jgi:hypothetical protein